ncbi:MAG: hypothetical protein AABZ31_11595 [Bdellovibrionota bacterium]
MKIFASLILLLAISAPSYAAPVKDEFVSMLQPSAQLALVKSLLKVLPAYSSSVALVLKEIDALPVGTVKETTKLNQIPIAGLFERNAEGLNKVLTDVAFAEGRDEEDVAWLRKSLADLNALLVLVKKARAGQNTYKAMEKYIYISRNFVVNANEYEVSALLNPVSRFYCNLTIEIDLQAGIKTPIAEASESCD